MVATRFLVVDDFEHGRISVPSISEPDPSLRVVGEARDGVKALKRATTLQPEIMLRAIGIPRLNGIEAARKIRHACPKSKIIFLTQESNSYPMQRSRDRCQRVLFES